MKQRLIALLAALVFLAGSAYARIVQGTVYDASTQEPIVGASVLVKGSQIGAATDIDGHFRIDVPSKDSELMVSYIGMKTQVVKAVPDMKIYLETSMESLDEVMVVAYGTQKKSSITGAISQVGADELSKRPVTSVTEALEGSTPGITITGNYGSPGSDPSIYIRGVGTVNGSTSPLYVIDGVPYGGNISDLNMDDIETMSVLKDAASAALYGNRASNGVILITTKKSKNERIQFTFKTNQGWYERALPEYDRTNAFQFMEAFYQNYANAIYSDGEYDRTNPEHVQEIHKTLTTRYLDESKTMLNQQYIFHESNLNTNIFNIREASQLFNVDGTLASNAAILDGYTDDLDWFDQATRKGYRQEYVFNGSGATQKSDYYFSLAYLDENGYMKDSGFKRFSGRATINLSPVKWFKSGLNINATHQKFQNTSNGVGDGSSSYNNAFNYCRYVAPIYPVHQHYLEDAKIIDANGNITDVHAGDYMGTTPTYDTGSYTITLADGTKEEIRTRNQNLDRHVILESELNMKHAVRNTMNSIAYFDINLPYGFIATLKGNLNTRNSESYDYGSAVIGDSKARGGTLSKTIYNYKNWTLMEQLRWNHSYGVHNIDVLLGHENYSYLYDYTYGSKQSQAFAGVPAFSNFSDLTSLSGYRDRYRTESYLARFQYNYDDRYNVEGSIRRDGSSRFSKDSRWGTFGSLGANWVFSNEAFMKDFTWLNSGKLRADWGQVGNDAGSGYYAYYALFGSWTQNSNPAYILSQNAAPNLKWETGESWGLALEGRLFNRLNFVVEYYDKRNKDLIFNVYAPVSAGPTETDSSLPEKTENIGTMSNRGFEFSFDVDIFKNKDWTVNFGANLSTLKNKIVTLPDQNKKVTTIPVDPNVNVPTGITSGQRLISEGKSRYEWYTYHWAGVDMMDGRSLYDANLVDYHVVDENGNTIGGKWKLDDDGNPIEGQLGSTELKAADYRLINGRYYVVNTTYAQKKWAGTSLPSVFGSFNGKVRWKNLNVSAMFTYSLGGKIYDSNYASLMSVGSAPSNLHTDIMNSWNGVPEGMTADSPDRINRNINNEINYVNNTQNTGASDRWLTSRDYLCFKNLNVSYSLPKTVTRMLTLNNVMLSFSAENLVTWGSRKGMNPMMGLNGGQSNYLVPARTYTFGLTVNL